MKDDPIPRLRMESTTPVKLVGACVEVTLTTDPATSLFGCRRLKSVERSLRVCSEGCVLYNSEMSPFPFRRAGDGFGIGGVSKMTLLAYGYADVEAADVAVEKNRRKQDIRFMGRSARLGARPSEY